MSPTSTIAARLAAAPLLARNVWGQTHCSSRPVVLGLTLLLGCSVHRDQDGTEASTELQAFGWLIALAEDKVTISVRVGSGRRDLVLIGRRSQLTGTTLHLRPDGGDSPSIHVPVCRLADYQDLLRRMEGKAGLDVSELGWRYREFVRDRLERCSVSRDRAGTEALAEAQAIGKLMVLAEDKVTISVLWVRGRRRDLVLHARQSQEMGTTLHLKVDGSRSPGIHVPVCKLADHVDLLLRMEGKTGLEMGELGWLYREFVRDRLER